MADVKSEDSSFTDTLWVLTKVENSTCALDSSYVEAIFMLNEEITKLPHGDNVHLGIVEFRDNVLPLIDLRGRLGIKSQKQELQEFEDMLEHRKQDHIDWVEELQRCVEENDTFQLTTNPHQCTFGKWYDNYVPISQTVAFQLKKIDVPHKNLHASAETILSYPADHDQSRRKKALQEILDTQTRIYMKQVVDLLDDTKKAFRDSYRQMVIVLSENVSSCGVIVDEVLSVETLTEVTGNQQLTGINERSLVHKVAQSKKDTDLVLILNETELLELAEVCKTN